MTLSEFWQATVLEVTLCIEGAAFRAKQDYKTAVTAAWLSTRELGPLRDYLPPEDVTPQSAEEQLAIFQAFSAAQNMKDPRD